MIATKSYIDVNGQIIIDGQPLQFVKLQQNLKAKPSRHRKPPHDSRFELSVKEAVLSYLFVMACFATMYWIVSIVS